MSAIAILYPGAMGASLAAAIHACSPDIPLLTLLAGRSQSTTKRASDAGLKDAGDLTTILKQSKLIFSVLPPGEAIKLAQDTAQTWKILVESGWKGDKPIYLDGNAVSPTTINKIISFLQPPTSSPSDPLYVPFLDGSIIGGPARKGYDPKVYISASSQDAWAANWLSKTLGGGGVPAEKDVSMGKGLKIELLSQEAGVAGASALKMSYAAVTKGSTGLLTAMILASTKHSPATAKALVEELASSQPAILTRGVGAVQDMLPKAYRWVAEMEEISEFIAYPTGRPITSSSSLTQVESDSRVGSGGSISDIYRGIARTYAAVADDLEAVEKGQTSVGQVEVLKQWIGMGKQVLARQNK